MDINDTMKQNLIDLAVFLHETAKLDVSQLGSEWERVHKLIERHAVYVETYTLPDIDPKVAEFVPPKRDPLTTAELDKVFADSPFLPDGREKGPLSRSTQTGNGR